jgi:pyruvate dehydrogenase E2 component (dihydrolipoamide acetyltransferase)
VVKQHDDQAHLDSDANRITVVLPLMGEGVTEATFVKCLKKLGDEIRKDEPLFEVSTDKVDTEIPSPADGRVVKIVAQEGAVLAVSSPVVILSPLGSNDSTENRSPQVSGQTPGHQTPNSLGQPPHTGVSQPPSRTVASDSQRAPVPPLESPKDEQSAAPQKSSSDLGQGDDVPRASPLVRKVAKERQLDLNMVQGSGFNGRITLKDLEQLPPPSLAQPISRGAYSSGLSIAEHGALETKTTNGIETLDGVPVKREKMSKMRGLIAEHMVRSVRTSPHVTTVFEIDMHRVATLREASFQAIKKNEDVNLTYTAFFAFAAAQTIKQFPIVNVSVDRDEILWKDTINLGIAVALETGLIVPVIRNAGDLNLIGIARQIQNLAHKARNKKLSPEDVQGGTFSITNPGMFGSLVSAPIINQPQVAILSIGAIVKRPVVISVATDGKGIHSQPPFGEQGSKKSKNKTEDIIAIRPMVQVGLTFDHRVIDGEGGSKFLATFKGILENFPDSSI